jgi:hypothetical protein
VATEVVVLAVAVAMLMVLLEQQIQVVVVVEVQSLMVEVLRVAQVAQVFVLSDT